MHRECVTGFRRTRPRRSCKDFGLFCLAHGASEGNRYPCLACRGQGQIDDPADPPCPVEGYRNVRRLRCAAWEGSGRGTRETCREAYRQEKDEYVRLVYLRHEAIQKLTDDEIKALRELGI